MFKIKIFISIVTFSLLLIITSIIKNQTRELEKKINNLNKIIFLKEIDFNETQLDYTYLTSPLIIENKIKRLDVIEYIPMEYSKIFISMNSFLNLQNKLVNKTNQNEKKKKK
tara:strand:+ start:128 stop:463 length:336 start_codon:yes stop_codon:yes gene_type:complete